MDLFESASAVVTSNFLQILIPSKDRDGNEIPKGQEYWVEECLQVLGTEFGGATANAPAEGVWRDDDRGRTLLRETVVVVFCYVPSVEEATEAYAALMGFVCRLGIEGKQGAVGVYIGDTYYEIRDFEE